MDKFTRGYIEGLLCLGDMDGRDLRSDYDETDIDPDDLAQIEALCRKFKADNADDLNAYYDLTDRGEDGAGIDLYLTSQGHGAGFWDRVGTCGAEDGGCFDRLTKASKAYPGEVYVYLKDDDSEHALGVEGLQGFAP